MHVFRTEKLAQFPINFFLVNFVSSFRLYIVADGMFGSRIPMAKANREQRDVDKKFLSYR